MSDARVHVHGLQFYFIYEHTCGGIVWPMNAISGVYIAIQLTRMHRNMY